jgi:UDP-galactopyranose mutase
LHTDTINQIAGDNWAPSFTGKPTNFEEASLSRMPYSVYSMFVKGYTEKQWGVPASHLETSLAGRFDVRRDGDSRLSTYEHQGLPKHGYAALVENMLDNIPISLGIDYLEQKDSIKARKKLIFTGSIDEYFGFSLGRLQYRAQRRSHTYDPLRSLTQPSVQINYPDPSDGTHIRTVEWKHLLPSSEAGTCIGTVITTETPFTPSDPHDYEYPFPSSVNRRIFEDYSQRAKQDKAVLICGRLGEYRYYDMDQAIGRAMMLTKRELLVD